ncbi:hypothetical protein M758_7G067700 [Ceratodon purpureus]|nr:hypothetical protein M758_7G067700 [Ceratodon purpureus]
MSMHSYFILINHFIVLTCLHGTSFDCSVVSNSCILLVSSSTEERKPLTLVSISMSTPISLSALSLANITFAKSS